MATSTSSTSSSSSCSSSFPHLVRTATAAIPMASPIWEEPPSIIDDDDVPLSFHGPSSSSSTHAAGIRRSQTVTAAGSRLHRIGSSNSSTSPGGAFNTHNGLSSTSSGSFDRPLSVSTGVSRHTSMKTTSPSLNRVVEGSTPEEEAQYAQMDTQYPSNAYLPAPDDDNQALYAGAPSSLARHSSMPVSRAYRRDPNNPGAPWQRNQKQYHHQQYPISPPASSSNVAAAGSPRPRSNSTAAAEAQVSNAMTSQAPIATSSFYQATSPNAPSSPLNSGFVVTSRPNSQIQARNAVGYNQHFSPPMSSAPGHGRSMSSHGWSSTETSTPSHLTHQHSPAHSRHASESLSHSGSSQARQQLGRVPSNASTSSSHAHKNTTGSNNSNHNSTPSPASPIDTSLLGQNNPWSPTAEERMHFRELSSTLNLATLRPQGTSSSNGVTDGVIESSLSTSTAGPISPPSSRRGSAFKDPSSPRRANSLSTHGRTYKPRSIDEPIPQVPSVIGPPGMRQPQRKNTPILPPLVTSSEALYTAATENTNGQGLAPGTGPAHQQSDETHLAQSTSTTSRALQSVQNGLEQSATGLNGAKIIRGPASAAPYVPPIGHTHASDRAGMSPEFSTQHAVAARQHHEPYSRNNQSYGQAPPIGLEHINQLRGFTTAGPGIPESSYLQERERITGLNTSQYQQQRDHNSRQEQQHHSFPTSSHSATPLSPQTATSLNSAITMQFPSLHNMNSAAALTNNLQLQQHLLAQQTQQLHEQQNQLAAALSSGLNLQDKPASLQMGNTNTQQQQHNHFPIGLPASPPHGRSQFQPNEDPYTIAAKIEALQKANNMLVAAMNEQNEQQQHLMQQSHPSHQHPGMLQMQMGQQGVQYPVAGMYGSFAQLPPHHSSAPSADWVRPVSVNGTNGQQSQQRHEGISPIDIHALTAAKGYNPREFDAHPPQARFFVIKSFTEDDVFKSIKFEIWSSTVLGNNRLDKAFTESSDKGPIYLFFSVNASGHFCGVAEMLTPLDYSVTSSVWSQGDKWKGVMKLRWIYIKDIPNPALRHLKLVNTNEQKPVTSSRDTQEVPYEQGCEMLHIFGTHQSKTSLLQDFAYYQAQTATPSTATARSTAPVKSPPPHNGTPAGPPTQAGHPNSYNGQQNRSSTPLQQQEQSSYQHNAFHNQPLQQQNYRSRQTAPLKR